MDRGDVKPRVRLGQNPWPALGASGHFTSSRTCGMMLSRAVSEGDAARPITASHLRARMQD
jgi:hypothetical protein